MLLLDTLRLLDFSNLITISHESLKIEWEKGLFNQKGKVILPKSSPPTVIEDPTIIVFNRNSSPYAYSTPYGN